MGIPATLIVIRRMSPPHSKNEFPLGLNSRVNCAVQPSNVNASKIKNTKRKDDCEAVTER